MSRSTKVIKNIVWDLLHQVVVILLGFLAPRFIISTYGSAVNGLSSSITQILGIILLLQSGATTAAVYSLYKPIADKDIEKISRQVSATSAFFKRISYVFFVLMIIAAFLSANHLDSTLDSKDIFIAFIILGVRSFLDLLISAKFRVVFTAYENKYLISVGTMIEQIIYYSMVFVTIYFKWNYLFLFIWLFLGSVIKILYFEIYYKKYYSFIKPIKIKEKKELVPNRNYALANEIAHSSVITSITIIIAFLYGLEEASVFAIYNLVFSAIYLVMTAISSSFGPSFANQYAENDKGNETVKTFSLFQYIYEMTGIFFLLCTCFLILPFVNLYAGDIKDINYINPPLAYLYIIMMLFSLFRIPYNIVVSSCGFFKQTWLQPVISAVLSVVISILLGRIDYSLVLVGPIVFYLTNFLYQNIKLKKLVPHLITGKLYIMLGISIIGLVSVYLFNRIVTIRVSIFSWLIMAVCVMIVSSIYLFFASKLFLNSDLKMFIGYLTGTYKRIFKK